MKESKVNLLCHNLDEWPILEVAAVRELCTETLMKDCCVLQHDLLSTR